MKLVCVYDSENATETLFDLLKERDRTVNISHMSMPSWDQHCAFIASRPYKEWRFIEAEGERVGACYLTNQNEIGIFVFTKHQGKGFGKAAVCRLIEENPEGRLLANVAPLNEKSRTMFEKLGFRHIQNTLALSR